MLSDECERRREVVLLAAQRSVELGLRLVALQAARLVEATGGPRVAPRMAERRRQRIFAEERELLRGVLTNARVEREPPFACRVNERLVAERAHHIHRRTGDALGGLEREASGEDRAARERALLLGGQEIPGSVDGLRERRVARVAAAGAEHVVPGVEAARELAHAEEARACGSELDGERDPVEPPHDVGERSGVRPGISAGRLRARHEELHRLGRGEGRQLDHHLTAHREPFARRDHDRERGRRAGPRRDGLRRKGELLEVVEHEEGRAEGGQGLGEARLHLGAYEMGGPLLVAKEREDREEQLVLGPRLGEVAEVTIARKMPGFDEGDGGSRWRRSSCRSPEDRGW